MKSADDNVDNLKKRGKKSFSLKQKKCLQLFKVSSLLPTLVIKQTFYLYCKNLRPQSYFRYTFLNTHYSVNILCKYEKKIKVRFLVIHILENAWFVCNSMGNAPIKGAITSILKHKGYYSKTHLIFFLIFTENVILLSRNIIKLIPFGTSTL